ncbi:MAG: tetratricopeptide repeat protein, partial [Myxococcales bacterium]|nr:tetratricopeptide repeat protein [Myxococcales bacterium]
MTRWFSGHASVVAGFLSLAVALAPGSVRAAPPATNPAGPGAGASGGAGAGTGAGATGATSAAAAQASEDASVHFKRGLQLFDEGDYTLALVEFNRAYQLAPNYRALYNIAL